MSLASLEMASSLRSLSHQAGSSVRAWIVAEFQARAFVVTFDGYVRSFHTGDGSSKKGKQAPLQERKMVDRFRLHVRGGEGGSGCTSFRKSRHSRHGVADV